MKKDDNDMFPQDNVVDGVSRPKVRKKSSSSTDNSSNTSEYGSNDENRYVSSSNVTNMPTPNSDDFNANLTETSSYDINDEGVSEESSENDNSKEDESKEDTFEDDSSSEDENCDDCDDDCDLNDCYYNNCSNSCNLDIAVLNELSKMCQTAMNNISYLVKSICNSNMKKELVSMYSQYSNILFQVNQHFEKYGEVPDCVSIGCKVMGFCGIKMNTLKNKSSSHVADIMIQGTLLGVIKCQKILNCKLNIDESTTTLLKDFNKFQRDNIDKLNAYL